MEEQSDPVSCHRDLELYEGDTKRSWLNSKNGRGFTPPHPKMFALISVDSHSALVEMDKHEFLRRNPLAWRLHILFYLGQFQLTAYSRYSWCLPIILGAHI